MDHFLLLAVVTELAGRLLEQEVLRVTCLGSLRYVIRFSTPSRDNLLVSVRPDLPRMHLLTRERRLREEPPDRFAALLDGEIGGAILTGIVKRPWDRIVELRFRLPGDGARPGRERRLVAELFGRSANLYVLDERGTILGVARERAQGRTGAARPAAAGAAYTPPAVRSNLEGLPEGPGALEAIRARHGDAAAFLGLVSPLFAREAAEDPEVVDRLLSAQARGGWSPVVYSHRPLAALEGPPDGERGPDGDAREEVVAAPLPLLSMGSRIATPLASPSEAAEVAFGLVEGAREFRDRRLHHQAIVKREMGRLETLVRKLESESAGARDADRHRRHGEALLAGLAAARLEGDAAIVPDPYDPAGGSLRVPIDPSVSLQDNAQALFARFKKAKRGQTAIATRLAAVRRRLEEWSGLRETAADVRGPDDLDRLRESMARLGMVHAPRPRRRPEPRPERDAPARVRRHTSPDGMEILVGKSGEENDTLTFRVAAPHDFWLHVADRPGAHVVVRNPRRLKTMPDATLRLAAEMAAYYSDARREGKAEVHYTQRKHVHKRKGMPGGQVLVRKFRTIQVAPRLPAASVEDV